jgi:hypothetical protein
LGRKGCYTTRTRDISGVQDGTESGDQDHVETAPLGGISSGKVEMTSPVTKSRKIDIRTTVTLSRDLKDAL